MLMIMQTAVINVLYFVCTSQYGVRMLVCQSSSKHETTFKGGCFEFQTFSVVSAFWTLLCITYASHMQKCFLHYSLHLKKSYANNKYNQTCHNLSIFLLKKDLDSLYHLENQEKSSISSQIDPSVSANTDKTIFIQGCMCF